MNVASHYSRENKSQLVSSSIELSGKDRSVNHLVDNRSMSVVQGKLWEKIDQSVQKKKNPFIDHSSGIYQLAMSERLKSEQVIIQSVNQPLLATQLPVLRKAIQGAGNKNNKPIIDGLHSGSIKLTNHSVHIDNPLISDGSCQEIANGVLAMKPKETALEVHNNTYRVMARLNPWLQVQHGTIVSVNTQASHNAQAPGPDWTFVTYPNLQAAGVNRHNPIGQSWPPGGGGMTSAFTVPSTTFNPAAMPSAFHSLPHNQLPAVPQGYTWTGGGSMATPYVPMRDPVARPSSPGFDVSANDLSGRLTYRSYHQDPTVTNPTGVRVLSAYTQAAAAGHTYGGSRNYPMHSSEYVDPVSGIHYGRGHAVDHADGDAATTSSANNYVPENQDFNTGARNHLVQDLRRQGGGYYQAHYQYASAPPLTQNGTAIPSQEHFIVAPQAAPPAYYAVPMQGYPSSRSTAAVQPFQQPFLSAPFPQWQ